MVENSISRDGKYQNEIRAFRIRWQGIAIYLKWEPNAYAGVISHLQIQSEHREAMPVTETGYRSHFCQRHEVEVWGGPVPYIRAWLDQESQSEARKTYAANSAKTQLFTL